MGIETTAQELHRFAVHLLRRLRKEDEACGLSASRLSALSVVVFGGPCSLGTLAEAEQVKPPTMTKLVQALEREGYVIREPDPNDRRTLRIRATEYGQALMGEARDARMRVLEESLKGLSEEEQALLQEAAGVLGKLLDDVG